MKCTALFAAALLFFIYLVTACEHSSKPSRSLAPEILGSMPSFQLRATDESVFHSDMLKGRIGILNFFFSSCSGICPTIHGNMRSVVAEFADKEDFVVTSISIDPKRDSVEKLVPYAKKFIPPDFHHWYFLTQSSPEESDTNKLATEGFRLAQGDRVDMHSTRIVLFDQNLSIRGFYKGLEASEVVRLKEDLRALFAESAQANAPKQGDREYQEVLGSILSPYCPGRLLQDCPSAAATELKAEIRTELESGKSPEEVKNDLYARFGDELRSTPGMNDFGLIAWFGPVLFFILGVLVFVVFLKKR